MLDNEFIQLRDDLSKELEPKRTKLELDCWNFYINSTPENLRQYEISQEEVYKIFRNKETFDKLKEFKEKGLNDTHLAKQLKDLLRDFDEELNTGAIKRVLRDKENEIAQKYNSYIATIDGQEITKPEISKLLQTEKDVTLRKKAYEARVKGGDLIADNMVKFINMRNAFSKTKGYNNYFDYAITELYDVQPKYLDELLNDVYANAKDLNYAIQEKNKKELAAEYGISEDDLKAYHYGLLLDNNPRKEVNKSFATTEQVVDIAKQTYLKMGYNIDNMPITLDLFPRQNKNTHGFCFCIQPGKDSRILANLTNDSNSLDTLCHELGHCVYNIGISNELPYMDQDETPAMTEAVAMMMGDLQQREDILKGIVPDDVLERFKADFKNSEAKFISRSMLIIEFEKRMYENPEQDLQQLWLDLRIKYLLANPDDEKNNEWATIPHYLSHPGYYQNYFRANLIKAQLYSFLRNKFGALTDNKTTAHYLGEKLFKYGTSIEENDLIKIFTGEPLSSKALCDNLK